MSITRFNTSIPFVLTLVLAASLSGCGGGGSASDDETATPSVPVADTAGPVEEDSTQHVEDETPPGSNTSDPVGETGVEQVQDETPTLTFDLNGGDNAGDNVGDIEAREVIQDEEYGDLPHPTRFGYGFIGWFTEPEGGRKVGNSEKVTAGKDHTLYAHWEPNPEMYLAELTEYEWTGDQDAWRGKVLPGEEIHDNHGAVHSYGFVGQSEYVDLFNLNTVTYDIDKGYTRFTASWGLRDSYGATISEGNELWLEISGDGNPLHVTPQIVSGSALKPIDIDVTGVQYLKIELHSNAPPSGRIDGLTGYGLFDPILIR
ncbi:MAG: InlB B-repeat-containing protein [Bifidobacteriaceae bacterium]|jgi:uncharacterized repeat protein (TIGR02543 family)|nr:InlB B-repeat-containing protein [Bifidobacteriaceae bacterium]